MSMNAKRVTLPTEAITLSQFAAGFWRLRNWQKTPEQLLSFIHSCMDMGVTTMDHAMVYKSEALFGEALALQPALRQDIEIVTKCGIRPAGFGELGARHTNHYDSSADHIIQSTEQSLRQLKTDYIDLLLIHRPDYLMDINETANALNTLTAQGKVLAIGVSNFTTSQFSALQSACNTPLVTNQIEFSPYNMQALDNGVFDQCQMLGIKPMLWSCLAGGLLANPRDEKSQRIMKAVKDIQRDIGAETPEQVIYAWAQALPCQPIILLGTSKPDRIRQALASQHYRLDREQWYKIWEASTGASVP